MRKKVCAIFVVSLESGHAGYLLPCLGTWQAALRLPSSHLVEPAPRCPSGLPVATLQFHGKVSPNALSGQRASSTAPHVLWAEALPCRIVSDVLARCCRPRFQAPRGQSLVQCLFPRSAPNALPDMRGGLEVTERVRWAVRAVEKFNAYSHARVACWGK